jgi:membrane protease YdiL (CAAX protease family)
MPPDEREPDDDLPYPIYEEWEVVDPVPTATPVESTQMVFCQRCGETSEPVDSCCPWCNAWLVGEPPKVTPVYKEEDDEPEDDWHARWRQEAYPVAKKPSLVMPMVTVGVSYFLLLASLVLFVLFAVILQVSTEEELHTGLAIVEIIDGILTLVALGLVWKTARQKLPPGTIGWAWLVAFPFLFALLCVNIAYISFLRELFRPFGAPQPEKLQMTWVTLMLICVQPAIIEELFFRQMVLGVFRKALNMHLAVWLTAAMFAFAHLGNPIGMPYLFLAGGLFGYARVYGGLPLAMIMHFLHNFAVVAYEAWR